MADPGIFVDGKATLIGMPPSFSFVDVGPQTSISKAVTPHFQFQVKFELSNLFRRA
jgi:hypothetical protein